MILIPISSCGETLEEREQKKLKKSHRKQIKLGFIRCTKWFNRKCNHCLWTYLKIGTGLSASSDDAEDKDKIHKKYFKGFIRQSSGETVYNMVVV